ncbi:MAG: T9SS type A sorting domain-containing protein [Prevotella sp.]|nr:T9SS type A sorting domain-containing protein [Prevotella sp.]
MNKKTMISMLLTLLLCLQAKADGGQTIIINGNTVEKTVTRITFSGDQVVLRFSDNTTQTSDMASISITLSANQDTGIGNIEMFTFSGKVGNKLDISNIADGTTIEIFNTSGVLMQKAKASGSSVTIDISSLKKGIYVLRAGSQVVKFMKQ